MSVLTKQTHHIEISDQEAIWVSKSVDATSQQFHILNLGLSSYHNLGND